MQYNLFLDDERFPKSVTWEPLPLVEWVIVRNYHEFVKKIKEDGLPLRISFDHDLSYDDQMAGITNEGGNNWVIDYSKLKERSGYECASWLTQYCHDRNLEFPEYFVHTMNPVGKCNIHGIINSYKRVYEERNPKG